MHVIGPLILILFQSLIKRDGLRLTLNAQFLGLGLFSIFFLSIYGALQYEVGTDYQNYIKIYETNRLNAFSRNNEFVSVAIFKFLHMLNSNPQFIFVVFAVLQATFLHIIFSHLYSAKMHYGLLLFFFITATGMYFNQLNQLRQFSSFYAVILSVQYLCNRKILIHVLCVFVAIGLHQTAIVFLAVFYVVKFTLLKVSIRNLFFIGGVGVLLLSMIVVELVDNIFPNYTSYVERYHDNINSLSLITKSYYVLIILIIFWFVPSSYVISFMKRSQFIEFCMKTCVLTVFIFLIPVITNVGVFSRITSVTTFFYIFPLYLGMQWLIERRYLLLQFLLISSMIGPLFFKLTFFATAEYSYTSVFSVITPDY